MSEDAAEKRAKGDQDVQGVNAPFYKLLRESTEDFSSDLQQIEELADAEGLLTVASAFASVTRYLDLPKSKKKPGSLERIDYEADFKDALLAMQNPDLDPEIAKWFKAAQHIVDSEITIDAQAAYHAANGRAR